MISLPYPPLSFHGDCAPHQHLFNNQNAKIRGGKTFTDLMLRPVRFLGTKMLCHKIANMNIDHTKLIPRFVFAQIRSAIKNVLQVNLRENTTCQTQKPDLESNPELIFLLPKLSNRSEMVEVLPVQSAEYNIAEDSTITEATFSVLILDIALHILKRLLSCPLYRTLLSCRSRLLGPTVFCHLKNQKNLN